MIGEKPQPFFIFGSPRSGTSLLSRMIDSHENLVVPNESLIFKMFSRALSDYGDLNVRSNQENLLADILATRVIQYWNPPAIFEDTVSFIQRPGFAGVVEALICSRAQEKNLKAWGEKSPGHVFYWKEISNTFPDAKIIHILRDGRDVASSIIKARMGPKTYYAAAKMWSDYLNQIVKIKRQCSENQFLEIRYEDLLSNSKENLEKICDFLGVPYSESMLSFYKKDTNYKTDAINLKNLNRPVITSNKDKWRTTLSKEQLQEFETVAGNHLETFGYGQANKLGNLSPRQLNYIKYINSPVMRFISRAKDTQGQKEFLSLKSIRLKRKIANFFSQK